jgi:sugar/nucleoside kinase (ribokinase family)
MERVDKIFSREGSGCCAPFVRQVSHVQQPENWAVIEKAQVIYSAGFFITVSPEAIAATSKHAAAANKIYAMNLSAPFIMQVLLTAYPCSFMPL